MIRVVHITGTLDMGGIENFLMNIYRNIDRNKVQFDFIVNDNQKEYIFENEIREMGGNIYKVPSIVKKGHFAYIKGLRKIFIENKYQIVHSHYNAITGIILNEAKKSNIKNRIAHSHTAPNKEFKYRGLSGLYKIYSKSLINKTSTLRFACSQKAGEWLYGVNNKFKVINNGINPQEYLFNIKKRSDMREKFNLKVNDIVIGHVGRFSREKNHSFLIDIFNELLKINKNYKLLLVGDGNIKEEIEKKVQELNIKENVKFLGIRKDVKDILQGLDIFILPSIFEGLPVTLVEAQGAGLKCFISDNLTREIDLECGLIEFISLNKSAQEWAEIIDNNKEYERKNTIEALRRHGYDMIQNVKELENLYIELYNEEFKEDKNE